MSTHSRQAAATALPPQRAGIARLDGAEAAGRPGGPGSGSVQASVSCGDLPGLARSMCYASKGIKY